MLSSLARTFSRFSEQPSEAFPDVAGTLQIHPNPWNLLDSWNLLWKVQITTYIEATPQWHSQAAKKTLTSSPKMGKLGQSPHVSNDEKHKHLSKTSKSLVCIWTLTISITSGLWPGPSWTCRSPPWSDSPAVYTPSGYGNPVAKKHTLCTLWHILTPCCPLLDISFACHGPGWIQLWQVPSPALQPPQKKGFALALPDLNS